GLPAHQVDLIVKTLCLIGSTIVLFLFSRWYTSESGAYCVIGFYLLLTVAGFIGEQSRVFFTKAYVMVGCGVGGSWFGAGYLIRAERYLPAALLTFVGAWAKETMLLVLILLAFEAIRSRRAPGALVVAVVAFPVPPVV